MSVVPYRFFVSGRVQSYAIQMLPHKSVFYANAQGLVLRFHQKAAALETLRLLTNTGESK